MSVVKSNECENNIKLRCWLQTFIVESHVTCEVEGNGFLKISSSGMPSSLRFFFLLFGVKDSISSSAPI